MTKVLIFTDSRGEHKATFKDQHIFTEKVTLMLKDNGFDVDKMCCPFSWTSTLDFIEIMNLPFNQNPRRLLINIAFY